MKEKLGMVLSVPIALAGIVASLWIAIWLDFFLLVLPSCFIHDLVTPGVTVCRYLSEKDLQKLSNSQ